MDIEHTLFLMTTRPRMFVINASGMYHFYSGVFSQKRESGISKDNEANLLVCFLEWKKKALGVNNPEDLFNFYDTMENEDGLACMAKDLLYVYKTILPSYIHPADRPYQ
ncbi:hypothetical protein [Bartonella sp. HY406]|uniref:hypothetical protein n=1 Tax=Bartonella sp. HY406 TaxID=2979331 RepID=UPI0021C59F5C|nr:hypothetical protein [Bartonella sp. HY406]UXN03593.1 hypothetical protein N6B01_00630 [Bartonella sp. HY406]